MEFATCWIHVGQDLPKFCGAGYHLFVKPRVEEIGQLH